MVKVVVAGGMDGEQMFEEAAGEEIKMRRRKEQPRPNYRLRWRGLRVLRPLPQGNRYAAQCLFSERPKSSDWLLERSEVRTCGSHSGWD
jgi:hypothetical protein